jgi:hypothetical protein
VVSRGSILHRTHRRRDLSASCRSCQNPARAIHFNTQCAATDYGVEIVTAFDTFAIACAPVFHRSTLASNIELPHNTPTWRMRFKRTAAIIR